MSRELLSTTGQSEGFPRVLSMRQRRDVIHRILKRRLETVLPMAMRETGFDMWLILCQEDNLDPVFTTLMPMDTWCPILQVLVLCDEGPERGVKGINISGTKTHELYERPYIGEVQEEQWPLLAKIIEERDPRRIGINIGAIQWAAGGLTHNLYCQLVSRLPQQYVARLESAEPLATRWLSTLSDEEIGLYGHVASVAHQLIAECYSRETVVPGVTTVEDLQWHYWQRCAELGFQPSFKPSFYLFRDQTLRAQVGEGDQVIRPGDFVRCDVGFHYLRLTSDMQEWMYVLRPGEEDAPAGMKRLMTEANRLQDVFMAEFRRGLSGNELLQRILTRARGEGIPTPRVYSHSLGLFLHEPGPLIGLPWEQVNCGGRGDVRLEYNSSFTMELSVEDQVPEWGGQVVRLALEEDVVYTKDGCWPMDGRQTQFYLV